MSEEDSSSQLPPAPSEKAQTLKPAPFSSFINKNPTGKKVAPKAARRRPGAAAAVSSAPKPHTSTPAPSIAEEQPAQTESPPSTVPTVKLQEALQLATPAATQNSQQTEQNVTEPAATAPRPSTPAALPVVVVESSPAPTNNQDVIRQDKDGESTTRLSPVRSVTPRAEEELDSDKSPKRQRVETAVRRVPKPRPVARRNLASQPVKDGSITATPQHVQSETQNTADPGPQQPDQPESEILRATETTTSSSTDAVADPPGDAGTDRGAGDISAYDVGGPKPKPKPRAGRRKLPSWNTVNTVPGQEGEAEEISGTGSGTRSRPTTKSRGKRKAVGSVAVEDAEHEEVENDQAESQPPIAKARGKRKVTSAAIVDENGDAVEPAPKKPRKTRKDKGTTRDRTDGLGEGEHGGDGEALDEAAARPKKKAARKKRTATRSTEPGINAGGEGDGAEGERVRQRRSREREPTPSDAEDEQIDPVSTFMSNIASRNIRVGRLSERERKMREIDWVEVKQRRKDEMEAAINNSREARKKVDEELAQAGAARDELGEEQNSGPRFQMIDGQITLVQDSGTINREADADRMIELMEEVAEDDLTAPINSSSYMRDNKRFPEHFMAPGQGTRWGREATDQFYDALRRFGTDFAMINTCFPYSTRRSIKKKFNREEKEHPELIRQALSAPRNTDWTSFLADAGKEDDDFADVDRIKAELAELQKEADLLVKQAQDKAIEEKRQRRLAGIELTDDENQDGSAKENGKKKKKGRGKQVQFAQEENFEVVGTLDDDPNWGVE